MWSQDLFASLLVLAVKIKKRIKQCKIRASLGFKVQEDRNMPDMLQTEKCLPGLPARS